MSLLAFKTIPLLSSRATVVARRRASRLGLAPRSLIAPLILAFVAAGCDGGSELPFETSTEASTLQILPTAAEIDNHTALEFKLQRVFRDGGTQSGGPEVLWRSSDPSVASVDAAGRVTANLPGEVEITGELRGRSASARLRILRTQADLRLRVSDEVEVEAGTTGNVIVEAWLEDVLGVPIPGIPVEFSMESAVGAEVTVDGATDSSGRAVGVLPVGTEAGELGVFVTSPGLAAIQEVSAGEGGAGAGVGPIRGSTRVRVRPSDPAEIILSPSEATVTVGDSLRIEPTVFDRFGNEIEHPALTHYSGPSEVLSLRSGGWVRGKAGGAGWMEVEATSTQGSTVRARADVMVLPKQVLAHVSGSGQEVPVGKSAADPLIVRLSAGSGEPIAGAAVFWSVIGGDAELPAGVSYTDPEGAASTVVRSTGSPDPIEVEAAVPGADPVLFTLLPVATEVPDGSGGDDGSEGDGGGDGAETNPSRVEDLEVAGSTGSTVTLRFTEVDDGAGGPSDYHVRFRSGTSIGNWGSATVITTGTCANPMRGSAVGATRTCVVEGLAAGQDYSFQLVTMRVDAGGIRYGALSNSTAGRTAGGDEPGSASSLHLFAASTRLTGGGSQVQVQVTARDATGNVVATPAVSWSSSDPSIATVDAVGLVTARAVGIVSIVASAACCTDGTIQVEVVSPQVPNGPAAGQWPNEPAGFSQIAYNDWSTMPGDWGPDRWGFHSSSRGDPSRGDSRVRADAGAPGNGMVLEGFYPAGHVGGYGAGRTGYAFGSATRELFWGMHTKVDANFVNHPFQLKWHFVWMDDGSLLWIDWRDNPSDNPSISNLGLRFQGPGWVPRDYWFRNELVQQNVPAYSAPNFKPFPKGEWVRLELYLRMQDPGQQNGIIRLWQDGELILELTDHYFPGTGFNRVYHEGTYGGGSEPVPHDQSWYVAETYISTP